MERDAVVDPPGVRVGHDGAGRTVIQLAVAPALFERLMAFGADQAEAEASGDDEPYAALPVQVCWLRAA
jgi:hypothetical protein